MDPDTALREILEALFALRIAHIAAAPDEFEAATGDERAKAVDCLMNLAAWLKGDGFPPNLEEVLNDMHYYD